MHANLERINCAFSTLCKVSREFHPNFSAKWRRYLYILPLNEDLGEQSYESEEAAERLTSEINCEQRNESDKMVTEGGVVNIQTTENGTITGSEFRRFSVNRVNRILQHLEGKLLSYKLFARDTKASRNM